MAKSKNTKPLRLRMDEPGFRPFETHNRERTVGLGRGATKKVKRATHKRSRRAEVANSKMSGRGYGQDNYRYAYAD